MRPLNVLLVSLQENLCTFGIRSIFYAVRNSKHHPMLLYPNLKYELANLDSDKLFFLELIRFIKKNNIDVIGISYMSYQAKLVEKISGVLRSHLRDIPLIGGGIHVTAFPNDSLRYLDAVCLGEGELSFIDFLNSYSKEKNLKEIEVTGMPTRYTAIENYAGDLPFLDDLDSLQPFPILDNPAYFYQKGIISLLTEDKIGFFHRYKGNGYDITTSRGCPLNCTYCADNINKNLYGSKWKKIRTRSVNHVIAELKQAISLRPTIQFVNFHDDSFSSRPAEWLEEFVLKYSNEIKLPLMFRAIPGSIDERKMKSLSQLNVIAVGIGLQSGSYRVLSEVYGRPIKVNTFIETILNLHMRRLIPIIDVMLNNPYEKREDIIETINTLSALPRPFLLELYGFRFYPGTEITERALRDGIIEQCDTSETQANIQNNALKNYLNKIILITPYCPRWIILFLIRNEGNFFAAAILSLFVAIGALVNLLNFIFMVLRVQQFNPLRFTRFFYNTLDLNTSLFHIFPLLRSLFNRRK